METDTTARMGNKCIRHCVNVVNAGADCTYRQLHLPLCGRGSQRSRSTRYITLNFLDEGTDFVAFR